jgi:hypothetical protein
MPTQVSNASTTIARHYLQHKFRNNRRIIRLRTKVRGKLPNAQIARASFIRCLKHLLVGLADRLDTNGIVLHEEVSRHATD